MSPHFPMLRYFTRSSITLALCLLSACASQYEQENIELLSLPKTWQSDVNTAAEPLTWSQLISSPELDTLIKSALETNLTLAQQALDTDIAYSTLFKSRMSYVPELDARLLATRSPDESGPETIYKNDFSLRADLSYEVNLWGQVSDAKRAAAFEYAAAKAEYAALTHSIITQVASAWATLIESQQLESLRRNRLSSLEKNLNIIESGYRSGLNTALEVYLARNNLESERSLYIQSRQTLSDSRRDLALLMGEYPRHDLVAPASFPVVNTALPPKLPSELLMRRPDLQASWLAVLAQNSTLAVAHKARFPSLSLTGSAGLQSTDLSDILDDVTAWTFGASLIQPLLNAGALRAEELSQRAQLEQAELAYQEDVYEAFQEIESSLEKQTSLTAQRVATQQSRDNALQAEKLSFQQYLKGLVSFTTVLDAQRSAVDAEIQLISLKKQIFINTLTLHEVLAGEFDFSTSAVLKGSK